MRQIHLTVGSLGRTNCSVIFRQASIASLICFSGLRSRSHALTDISFCHHLLSPQPHFGHPVPNEENALRWPRNYLIRYHRGGRNSVLDSRDACA